jgi:hypothetical protein
MKYKLKQKFVACMYKKTNQIILKTTYILAVQMLIFIGSFYWLYKTLNTHFEYKSNSTYMHRLRFNIVRCVFLLFFCVEETYYSICVNIVMQ